MNKNFRIEPKVFPNLTTLKNVPTPLLDEMKGRYVASVQVTNEIFERLARIDHRASHPVIGETRTLLANLPTALGTVKSYEMFFSQLGGTGGAPTGALAEQIRKDFGSYENFLDQFIAAANASHGWAAVVFDLDLRRLMCVMGDTPEQLTVWNTAPIIVLEVRDRSITPTHGPERIQQIQTWLSLLDWKVVQRNLEDALGLQPAGKPY